MISGINHLTLSVHNLDKSIIFYTNILGCKLQAQWQKGAYLSAGSLWVCLILDTETRIAPLPEYTHIAFNVYQDDFRELSNKIKQSGTCLWKDNISEGDSLYFLDPNGHKFEIHVTTLQERLAACKKNPYPNMIFFDEK